MSTPLSPCKYLIYMCWDSGGTKIGGSLIHDLCPQTEDEARSMISTLQDQSESFFDKIIGLKQARRYVYIENKPTLSGSK
jgi:hypothetical protein